MVHTVVPVLLVVKHLVFIIECATFRTKRPYHRQICRESEIPVNPSLRSRSMNRAGGTRCNEWSDSNMCMDSFRCTSMPGGRGHHRWLIVLFLEFEATSTRQETKKRFKIDYHLIDGMKVVSSLVDTVGVHQSKANILVLRPW